MKKGWAARNFRDHKLTIGLDLLNDMDDWSPSDEADSAADYHERCILIYRLYGSRLSPKAPGSAVYREQHSPNQPEAAVEIAMI